MLLSALLLTTVQTTETMPGAQSPAPAVSEPDVTAQMACMTSTIGEPVLARAVAVDDPSTVLSQDQLRGAHESCTARYGWDERRAELMGFHFYATMMEREARQESGLSAAVLARLDRAYEQTDRQRLRQVAGPLADAYLQTGRIPTMSREQSRLFGEIASRAGLSNANASGMRADPIILFRLIRETAVELLSSPESPAGA
jgi:hypothetical protein